MNNPPKQKKWTAKEIAIAVKMFDDNKTHKEIAETLGRTYCSVAQKLNKIGKKRVFGTNQYYFWIQNPMKGRHHSEETKRKISDKAKTRFADMTKHPSWKGGRRITSNGYIEIHAKDHPRNRGGYVFEHILVMEMMLDRHLTSEEVVHHINQNRQDNRIENLMVFKNRKDHAAYHKNLRIMEVKKAYESCSSCGTLNG